MVLRQPPAVRGFREPAKCRKARPVLWLGRPAIRATLHLGRSEGKLREATPRSQPLPAPDPLAPGGHRFRPGRRGEEAAAYPARFGLFQRLGLSPEDDPASCVPLPRAAVRGLWSRPSPPPR